MKIHEKIKQRRRNLGLTLEKVADYVGVSKATVSRWESGEIENMRRDRISKLAEILKVRPNFIMGINEEESEEKKPFDPYFVDTSMLTAEELAEFNRVTGVNKQLFFNDVDEEHDMALFKQSVVEILIKQRDKKKK